MLNTLVNAADISNIRIFQIAIRKLGQDFSSTCDVRLLLTNFRKPKIIIAATAVHPW